MSYTKTQSMKPFFLIWIGQAVSLLGSQLVQFALIWWLTDTTGSATVLAMASLVGLVPQVILGPFIGVLVDRWNRRLIMLVADSVVAGATIILAYLFWIDVAQVWHIFLILFVRALAGIFHFPAMMASTTLMVPEAQLTRIQGLNQILQGALSIASAPIGALLMSLLPMQTVLGIDVVTAIFAIGPLFFVFVPQPERQASGEGTGVLLSFWEDMRVGFQYVRGWRGLMALTGMAMVVKILLNPAFALLPILVTDHFGGDAFQLGYMESSWGVGALLGGVLLSAWGGFKRRILTTLMGLMGLGLSLVALGAIPASGFGLAMIAIFGTGFVLPLVDGPIMAILQATIAPEKQGRVFMMFISLVSSTVPLGLIIAGPVADLIGVRIWFGAAGILTIVMSISGFFVPSVLNIESHRDAEGSFDNDAQVESQLPGSVATSP